MVQIYIDNKLIDLDNTNISLQKEFEDVVENIPTEIEYSYTVSIPATMNNKEIFGFTDTFDVANKFKRLYNADLYVDELLILSGKFKVTSIESGYYKGNIYNPKKKTISEILGDRNLNEIYPHWKPMNGLSDFDKINNEVCYLPLSMRDRRLLPEYCRLPYEWDCAEAEELGYTCEQITQVHDNHVVFPYILYTLPMNNPDEVPTDMDIYTQDLEYKKHAITEDTIYPAFNVVSVLKDIFKSEGYNLTGNIIDGNNKQFYNALYQTFQYSYDDYKKNKDVPFYCNIVGNYTNYSLDTSTGEYNPSPSLEIMTLFDAPEYTCCFTDDDAKGGGDFQYGVDNPWTPGHVSNGYWFSSISEIDDEKNMFVRGSKDENTGVLIVPKSGWYKIRLKGNMYYPFNEGQILTGVEHKRVMVHDFVFPTGEMMIGGTTDEADNTTLAEQPFEIQLKRGQPKENPRFYSFYSFVPMNAVECQEDKTVILDGNGMTYLKIPDGEAQRRYPKNGSAAYVKKIGDYNGDEFICGARLGGAWFSSQWGSAFHGECQRRNRGFQQGVGLALPDPTKMVSTAYYDNQEPEVQYKKDGTSKFTGWFLKMADQATNTLHEYANKTAQCLVRADSYTNFLGYNSLVEDESGQHYHWDTTSNYGAVSWEGADACSAKTGDINGEYKDYKGEWDTNTVVWLNEGETLYLEVLIPLHHGGKYQEPDCNDSSEWYEQYNWVNAIYVEYQLYLGFLNGNKEWIPRPDDGIDTFDNLKKHKLTNVNQFLPNMKCNDYLEKFLKTFNLQLTMKDSKTFSIDTIGGNTMLGNVIDIDKICNIDEAEFKPLKSDSIMEYKWKIDNSETGYAQGNQSPHKDLHGDSVSDAAWYESGYTGEETIINDANSSGSLKKTEAPWSYNWYKTIHFLHNYNDPPLTEEYSDVSVITDASLWKNGMSFAAAKEPPKTNKTMRLFTLKKNKNMDNKQFSYISFKYDEKDASYVEFETLIHHELIDKVCNLVLPSNYFETIDLTKNKHRLHIDYKVMNNTYDGNAYNQSLMDVFFTKNINGGYNIEVPIRLSNEDYHHTKQGTLYKLHDGLYRVKSIEGHDINKEDTSTLTLTTLK